MFTAPHTASGASPTRGVAGFSDTDYMSSAFRKQVPYLGISVEKGTGAVPEDGRYHVLRGEEIIYSTPSEAIALAQFELLEEAHPELRNPRDVIRREAAFSDIMGVKADAKSRRTAGEQARGGKGGRSGV